MAAAKKATEQSTPVATMENLTQPVYGTVAEAPGATVPVGERAAAVNLTEDGPDDPSDMPVVMVNPFGDAKMTVSSDNVKAFEDAGYKRSK